MAMRMQDRQPARCAAPGTPGCLPAAVLALMRTVMTLGDRSHRS